MLFPKITLLLWKNTIIRKRHWFLSLCETAIPVLLFLLVAYCKSQINVFGKRENEASYTAPESAENIYSNYEKYDAVKLLYTPDTDFTSNIIHRARQKMYILDEGM